jgi:DNA-directed RNA polymerase specialized sigma24 family protein
MLLTTDTELARRALRGDPEAFARVYEASFPCVWSFATRRLRSIGAAEALTEQILARVFRELDRYEGEVPFAAWLLELCKETARAASKAPTPARHGTQSDEAGRYPRSRK